MKGNENKRKQKKNVWKIISVIFIVMFCLMLIGGLMRVYHFMSVFSVPTQEQIDSAKDIIAQELENKGDDIDDYEISVSNRIIDFDRMGRSKGIFVEIEHSEDSKGIFDRIMDSEGTIQVSLVKNSTMHSYLIDVNSGTVVMHFFIEWV